MTISPTSNRCCDTHSSPAMTLTVFSSQQQVINCTHCITRYIDGQFGTRSAILLYNRVGACIGRWWSLWSVTLGCTLTLTLWWSQVMQTKSACLRQLLGIRRSIPRLSSSPWCCVWCYHSWTIATQYWPAFHYTLFGAWSQWWMQPHGSSSRHQSAITSRHTYANFTGWRSLGG